MLLNLLITCMALAFLCNAGYVWAQPPGPWRFPISGFAAATFILLVIMWLKIWGVLS